MGNLLEYQIYKIHKSGRRQTFSSSCNISLSMSEISGGIDGSRKVTG